MISQYTKCNSFFAIAVIIFFMGDIFNCCNCSRKNICIIIAVFVLQHRNNEKLNVELVKDIKAEPFSMRGFIGKTSAKVVGVTMFRTQWDDGMLSLMDKYNIEGSHIQMKRKAPEKLPYKKRDTRRMR